MIDYYLESTDINKLIDMTNQYVNTIGPIVGDGIDGEVGKYYLTVRIEDSENETFSLPSGVSETSQAVILSVVGGWL